jgi:hypothetical protein
MDIRLVLSEYVARTTSLLASNKASNFSKIHFNIILSTPRFSKWSLPFRLVA